MATYEDMAEMIRLGAYRKGTDAGVDQAIGFYPAIETFLKQDKKERTDIVTGLSALAGILGLPAPGTAEPPP